jgi:oligopeptide transport system ATP-binding protein
MASGAVNGDVVLRVSDLRISFSTYAGEVQAVRGTSFDLRQGETLAIVGLGKSVAARSIMRLNPESNTIIKGGEIVFEGEDLLKLSEKRMLHIRGPKIAMVFQDPITSLDPTMRVERQIMESLNRHLGMSGRLPSAPSSCSSWSVSRTPRSASSSTHTSSRAACVRGWSSA